MSGNWIAPHQWRTWSVFVTVKPNESGFMESDQTFSQNLDLSNVSKNQVILQSRQCHFMFFGWSVAILDEPIFYEDQILIFNLNLSYDYQLSGNIDWNIPWFDILMDITKNVKIFQCNWNLMNNPEDRIFEKKLTSSNVTVQWPFLSIFKDDVNFSVEIVVQ
jgi:hypothetical protein